MSKYRNFRTSLLPALLVLGLIAPSAQAATVELDGTGTKAIGITGFEFAGNFYDVAFVQDAGVSDDVYGMPPELDFMTTPVVQQVIDKVVVELNASPAVTVGPNFGPLSDQFAIAQNWNPIQQEFSVLTARYNNGWFSESGDVVPPDFEAMYATFAPSAVPVPAAAWLLGSGILGLVGMARRKKA